MDLIVKSESLTRVAGAIREKGGTSEPLVFPAGFEVAIMAIQSGVSGATLTVTTPAEGVTVTVAKGEASHTKTTGADKTATFAGLGTGTWTITISDGAQTATGTIDIDADYALGLTFFAATINITYKAGLVCTVSDGVTTLTAPDTSGTWACVVPNAGTWTVSVSGFSSTWTVSITANGQSKTVDASKVYLYNKGNKCTSLTGGWTSSGYSAGMEVRSGTLDSKQMTFNGEAGYITILGTSKAINLNNGSNIVFVGEVTSVFNDRFGLGFGISESKDTSDIASEVEVTSVKSFKTKIPIDSTLEGSYYVYCFAHGAEQSMGYVTEVYLE